LFTGQNFKQQDDRKWSTDPRMTKIYPTGNYVPLPQVNNYIHSNKIPIVYYTPTDVFTVAPNFRIYPSSTTQSEVPICRHPTNQNIMFASSNAVSFSPTFISEGVYVTTNGGVTWFGSDTTASSPLNGHGGDPAPAIAPNGYFHQSFLGGGMNAAYSTDNGLTWSNTYKITTGSRDKNHTFTNDVPSSAYYGRIYVTWSLFTESLLPAVVSYSTNNGVSFGSIIHVNTPASGHYSQGVNGAIAPNGDAYICWINPIAGSPYTGDYLGFGISTDGGNTWNSTNNVYDCNTIRGTLSEKSGIRVNGFPWMGVDRTGGSRAGWIYVVTGEKNLSPAGSDPDIIMHRSTDGGSTWSAGIRVNQDPFNNGKIQFFPCIRVDEGGGINVVYYDDRNTSSDSSEVYLSRSTDGGDAWTDILVSDHRFKPKPISGLASGYQGDYIGITSTGANKIWPYWCSDVSGVYQAWITSITVGPPPAHDFAVGPFLSLPQQFFEDLTYNIKTKVRNLGTSNETSVPIKFFVNGSLESTSLLSIDSLETDSVNYSWTPADMGQYTLAIASALPNDTNRLNDTLRTTVDVQTPCPTVSSFPYTQNFDSWTTSTHNFSCTSPGSVILEPCWVNFSSDDIDWDIYSGSTGSSNTGPSGDHTSGSGNYLYTESSSCYNHTGYILSPNFDFSSFTCARIIFWFHMYGSSMGSMSLQVSFDRGSTWSSNLWSMSGDQGNSWNQATVDLSSYSSQSSVMLRWTGVTGSSYTSDMAIDDITIENGTSHHYGGGAGTGGYYFTNSNLCSSGAPSSPTYNWIDISSSGDDLIDNLADDNFVGPLSIGFTFTFFGNEYTEFYINSNGMISFGSGTSSYNNTNIPSSGSPNNFIALFWDDLDPTNTNVSNKHCYYGSDENGNMVISLVNYPQYNADANGWITTQVIIFNDPTPGTDDRITFQYNSHGSSMNLVSSSVGLENSSGNAGLEYRYHGSGGPLFGSPLAIAFGPDDNVLPVELVSFRANVNKNDVTLNWTTASEINNAGFDVERQSLSSGKDIWTKIGYVKGYGTTNEPRNYTFQDRKLKSGKYNYRLVQRDYNNRGYEHFLSDLVTVGVPKKYAISQNYPNPFNPTTKIDYDLPYDGKVNIILYDITGRKVATLINEVRTAGYYTIVYNAAHLSSGTYFYRIIAKGGKNDFIKTKKMVLLI